IAPQRASFFGIWFTFALDGNPTWYVMPSGGWLDNRYSATMFRAQSSPWLGVTYDAAKLIVAPIGSVWFDLEADSALRFIYRFDTGVFTNLVQSKSLSRRRF
ncbi:MAG: hypothetical protein ACKO15_16415, partial [Burkholderiales bacterium]